MAVEACKANQFARRCLPVLHELVGRIVGEKAAVSASDWEKALRDGDGSAGRALDSLFLSDKQMAEVAEALGLGWQDAWSLEPKPDATAALSEHLRVRWEVAPLEWTAPGCLAVAVAAPLEPDTATLLKQSTGASELEQRLASYWRVRELSRAEMRPQVVLATGPRPAWSQVGTTFSVAEVEPAAEPLPETAVWNLVREQFHPLEACSDIHAPVLECSAGNCLIQAAYLAFSQHRPLVLSPDALWLTILHGVSQHIARDPERARDLYVSHQGKLKLIVQRDDFVLGSPENPWPELFGSFSRHLARHVNPDVMSFFRAGFSTSGPLEVAASEVMTMGALRHYFLYEMSCICGIPSVTLEGTAEDWRLLERKILALESHGLKDWGEQLAPIARELVRASEGVVERDFWRDLFQLHDPDTEAYGGPIDYFSGWIGKFCLYDGSGYRNPLLESPARPQATGSFPPAIGTAPLQWRAAESTLELELAAGLLAVEQRLEDRALRPKVGWVVRRVY